MIQTQQQGLWEPSKRKQGWVITALVASCAVTLAACSLTAFLLSTVIAQEHVRTQNHQALCTYLSTQLSASAHSAALAPLVPGFRSGYQSEGCAPGANVQVSCKQARACTSPSAQPINQGNRH